METARRLRLIQIDFADDTDAMRAECLHGEIERSLSKLPPDHRATFLKKLLLLFPIPCRETSSVGDQAPGARPVTDTEQLKDPEFLIDHLKALFLTWSSAEQDSFVRGLGEAGILPPVASAAGAPPDLMQAVIAALEMKEETDVRPDRVASLMALLPGFLLKLEPLVWHTWRTLTPRSRIRPAETLKRTAGRFVCADADVPEQTVLREIQVLQRLIAALIAAIGNVGKQFGKQYLARFKPAEIAALVQMEQGSVFVSREVRCWRKYSELAETLTEDNIDQELRKLIVDQVESLMKGVNR